MDSEMVVGLYRTFIPRNGFVGLSENFNNDCCQFKWKPFQKIWESVLIQGKVDTQDKINSEDLFNRKSD